MSPQALAEALAEAGEVLELLADVLHGRERMKGPQMSRRDLEVMLTPEAYARVLELDRHYQDQGAKLAALDPTRLRALAAATAEAGGEK